MWRLLTRQTQPPELIFPTAEVVSSEAAATEEAADVPLPTAESTEALPTAESAEAAPTAATNVLYTSHDPLHHFRLTFDGSSIILDGVYEGQEVTRMALDSGGSVKPQYEGDRVTAVLRAGYGSGYDELLISFRSGISIPVHILYDESGCPQPLLTDAFGRSMQGLAHPITIPPAAVMEYVLPEGSAAERKAVLEQVRDISEQICEGLDSDYDKARALAVWVSKNIYYDYVAYNSEVNVETLSLSRTLELQRSVCGGYANLYAALCQAQGLTCHVVKGTVIQGGGSFAEGGHAAPSHEWNVLELDGRHIWVDTLWNTDNAYNGEYIYGAQKLRYFDISDECMTANHRAERVEVREFFPSLC